MTRWLALDIGRKRTGVAVTDLLNITPGGLGFVETKNILSFLKEYTQKEPVSKIIIGDPKQLNGEKSESMKYIEPLVGKIRKQFPDIAIEWYDERYTTSIALRSMIDAGMSKTKRRKKGVADEIAAVIILRDYMDSQMQ